MSVTGTEAALLEGIWARHAVAHAQALRAADPSWGTTWFELADGLVVLQGAGLYVNRALALGLTGVVTDADLDELERRSGDAGVPVSVDVTPDTDAGLVSKLRTRGYAPSGEVAVMTMDVDRAASIEAEPSIVVRPIAADELVTWQHVSQAAWGHTAPTARRASDAYAAAAHTTAGERLVLAFDAVDERPLGCASLIVREGVATLGGMSTLPAERGRGVQRSMVAVRSRMAVDEGCELAAVSALVGGASERNLVRLGFTRRYVRTTWTRP